MQLYLIDAQAPEHGTHVGRQVNGPGTRADASRLTARVTAAEGTRSIASDDASFAHEQAVVFTGIEQR